MDVVFGRCRRPTCTLEMGSLFARSSLLNPPTLLHLARVGADAEIVPTLKSAVRFWQELVGFL